MDLPTVRLTDRHILPIPYVPSNPFGVGGQKYIKQNKNAYKLDGVFKLGTHVP